VTSANQKHRKHQLTSDEQQHIDNTAGIVAHPSQDVYLDTDTGERWALCWVRTRTKPTEDTCDCCGDPNVYDDGACLPCFDAHNELMNETY
jgi:hypothetical protein